VGGRWRGPTIPSIKKKQQQKRVRQGEGETDWGSFPQAEKKEKKEDGLEKLADRARASSKKERGMYGEKLGLAP